jgi:hypothetical protein
MGATASLANQNQTFVNAISANSYSLKELPNAIEEAIYVHEKFPLILDKSEQASRFLKYQLGSFFDLSDPTIDKVKLNRSLVGAFRYGKKLTLFKKTQLTVDVLNKIFVPNYFPVEVVEKNLFFTDEVWQTTLRPELGDPRVEELTISPEFVFIICCADDQVPAKLLDLMHVIKVDDNFQKNENISEEENVMAQVAAVYGAKEIVRNR